MLSRGLSIPQSVLNILGKSSTLPTNLDRLHLTIHDPSTTLRGKKSKSKKRSKGKERDDGRGIDGDDDGDGNDGRHDLVGGIEARLVVRLICKHG